MEVYIESGILHFKTKAMFDGKPCSHWVHPKMYTEISSQELGNVLVDLLQGVHPTGYNLKPVEKKREIEYE